MSNFRDMSIEDFVHHLNEKHALQLGDVDLKYAVGTLEDQWFETAGELEKVDADAFHAMELPGGLIEAIMGAFNQKAYARAPPGPAMYHVSTAGGPTMTTGIAPPVPVRKASAPKEERKEAPEKKEKQFLDVINQVMSQSSGNPFVVQGLQKLLKRGIEDTDNGTMKQQQLRDILKNVHKDYNKSLKRPLNEILAEEKAKEAMARSSEEDSANSDDDHYDDDDDDDENGVVLNHNNNNDGALNGNGASGSAADAAGSSTSPSRRKSLGGAKKGPFAPGSCKICGKSGNKQHALMCSDSFCQACVHDYIMDLVFKKKVNGLKCPAGCGKELEVPDVQKILSTDEFNQYLEATLAAYMEQQDMTFKCPNSTCDAMIVFEPNRPQEVPNPMTERDADGNLLTAEAWMHFQEFRARCRACSTVFCADCKNMPYHKGFTCKGYREFEKARHCRFCATRITDANACKNDRGPGLRDVCSAEECVEKRDLCCDKMKECGCPCNGVRDEEECLPCLKHDLDVAEDFCSICYVEALKDAPCIQFSGDCDHVFHYQCILNKINAKWPGARISFEFLNCPLCQTPMDHPALEKPMKEVKELYTHVKQKALERLAYEGRMKDPAIVQASGRFYENPAGFAMYEYLFYMCFKCNTPYFAGGYQCQEANAPFDPEELVCPSCQPQSVDDCPKHGKDWLAFKCRYCCNYANWYCWGRAHFCDHCHKSGVWQKLCEFRTGKNKKQVWEYDQCASLKEPVAAIGKDKSLSTEEKETALLKLLCDPSTCPIGIAHPPTGFEFGLGCSMCEDKKAEERNAEASRKALEEAKKQQERLSIVKKVLRDYPDGLEFQFDHEFDESGILYFLGTSGRTTKYMNPCDSGFVAVSCSGMMADSAPLSSIVGRELVRCVSKPIRNAYIQFDLRDLTVEPTHYMIRHYSSWDTECIRNWVMEGSNNGIQWDTLSEHKDDASLDKRGATVTFPVEADGRRYRMFRVTQTGVNSNNHYYLACSGMELYGRLFDTMGGGDEDEMKFREDDEAVQKFEYESDFDKHGVFWYLGTNGYTTEWQNPAEVGRVIATSSDLAERPASKPASALCGRELVRCVTVAKPNMWFVVDLREYKLTVTHYTLKHYNSWDTEALRNWRFEGSNDGIRWVTLSSHHNDEALNRKGATHTWPIPNARENVAYSMFRLYQTGKNSNNHYYLACSGMELYGDLYKTQPVTAGPTGLELSYHYDFDCNGLFYWIGTRGRKQPWRNPADAGLTTVTASALAANPPSVHQNYLVGRSLVRCVSAAQPRMWFQVDLQDYQLVPTHYTLRHYISWDTEALRNWVLEGSHDGNKWVLVSQHVNDESLNKKGATHTWPVAPTSQAYRYFRIRQTGLNSNNHHYLSCSGFELYGRVYDIDDNQAVAALAPVAIPEQKQPVPDGQVHQYKYDFDENGIFYWLGTNRGTTMYRNPGETNIVRVTSSPMASQSAPAYAACGRTVTRCVTEPSKNTYFCFDLQDVYVIPTAYTLRHYDSWDTEALRSWVLEGSNDGSKWKVLSRHKKDKSLDFRGATHTWQIKDVKKSYRMFKITQTGKNSNKHWYLSLSGFEIYGTVWSFRKKL